MFAAFLAVSAAIANSGLVPIKADAKKEPGASESASESNEKINGNSKKNKKHTYYELFKKSWNFCFKNYFEPVVGKSTGIKVIFANSEIKNASDWIEKSHGSSLTEIEVGMTFFAEVFLLIINHTVQKISDLGSKLENPAKLKDSEFIIKFDKASGKVSVTSKKFE
jgi:hypothetical protein